MSKTKITRRDIDRAQADLLLRRGLVDPASIQRAAQRLPGEEDLCAALLARGQLSAANARAIRGEALAALGLSYGSSLPGASDSALVQSLAESHSSEAAASAPPGYAVLEKVGQGAMGFVARARQLETGRLVALKTILATDEANVPDEDDIRRFQREAQTLILLKHPRLVEVIDFIRADGALFLIMELIEGQDLRACVEDAMRQQGGPPSWEQVGWVFRDLADALAYCHSQGVIHRDVKPQNIVLEAERAVLIDFGLIKRVSGPGGAHSVSLTQEGAVVGTPAFMGPEQLLAGEEFGPVSAASDVFGFGATLYFALSGASPYAGASMVDIAMGMKRGPPPGLSRVRPATPAWLSTLCAACLELDPKLRPSMSEVAAVLAAERSPDKPRSARRWRGAAALALVLLALAAVALAWSLDRRGAPKNQPAADPEPEPEPDPGLEIARMREALRSHQGWAAAGTELRARLGERVAERSSGALTFCGLERFERGGRAFEIARFDHSASGARLHLIPGGVLELPCFSDPEDRQLAALRALKKATATRAELAVYNDRRLRAAFVIFPEAMESVYRDWRSRGQPRDAERLMRAVVDGSRGAFPPVGPEVEEAIHAFFEAARERLWAEHVVIVETQIPAFLLGQAEMSEATWARLSGEAPRGDGDLPAVKLPCQRVLEVLRESGRGLRLPERAEWLHALAAGGDDAFSWSIEPGQTPPVVWCEETRAAAGASGDDARPRPASSARGAENAFGLVDMMGNVSEWAREDWSIWVKVFRHRAVNLNIDPQGRRLIRRADESSERRYESPWWPLMGGNHLYDEETLRRLPYYFQPLTTSKGQQRSTPRYGFRLALELPKLER